MTNDLGSTKPVKIDNRFQFTIAIHLHYTDSVIDMFEITQYAALVIPSRGHSTYLMIIGVLIRFDGVVCQFDCMCVLPLTRYEGVYWTAIVSATLVSTLEIITL